MGSSPKYNVDLRETKCLFTWRIDLDDIIEAFRLFDAILLCLVFLKFSKSTNSWGEILPIFLMIRIVNVFKVLISKPDRVSHN